MDDLRLVNPETTSDEKVPSSGPKLRPVSLQSFIGQEKVKENLALFLKAAQERNEPLDHVLLAGPPGLGKTTLAHIIAYEMKSQVHVMAGPTVEKKGDLAAVLTNLQPHDVLFIDEIHRLPRAIEEVLYSVMEDFKLDIIIGQGPSARTIRIDLPQFTLVGATTRTGLLTSPLRDRFGVQMRLQFYQPSELKEIVERSAGVLGFELDSSGALEVAKRSRGTPRVANRLLKRVRDYAQVGKAESVGQELASEALSKFEIDQKGLDPMDRKILEAIIDRFDGGPVGIESIAAAIGEERDTIEDVYEPFLIQEGLMQRTPRGRLATQQAYEHLGRVWEQTGLFSE